MRLRLPALAALTALTLAGCGTGRSVHLTGHRLALTLTEYRIAPGTTSVPPGRLRIVAFNRGILTHNVELERGTLDSAERPPVPGADIHTLLPGTRGAVLTPPLAPGHYLLVSTVSNQEALGMSATLIVR